MAWILYFISLMPLFGYLFIKYFDSCVFYIIEERRFSCLSFGQCAFVFSLLLFLLGLVFIAFLKYKSRKNFSIHGAKIIVAPHNINHELIGVLSSVVLPFLTVNFDTSNEIFASIFMLLVIGMITTRSNIYYKNPVLAILNLRIYQIEIDFKSFAKNKPINVISFQTLQINDSLYLKEMGENVYYAQKTKNG